MKKETELARENRQLVNSVRICKIVNRDSVRSATVPVYGNDKKIGIQCQDSGYGKQ
jgi:hypothetical protein